MGSALVSWILSMSCMFSRMRCCSQMIWPLNGAIPDNLRHHCCLLLCLQFRNASSDHRAHTKEKKKRILEVLWLCLQLLQKNVLFMTVWDISDGSCINLENKVKKKKEKWLLLHQKSIYPLYLKSRTQKKRKRKMSSRTISLMTWNTPVYVTGYRVSVIFIHLCT